MDFFASIDAMKDSAKTLRSEGVKILATRVSVHSAASGLFEGGWSGASQRQFATNMENWEAQVDKLLSMMGAFYTTLMEYAGELDGVLTTGQGIKR